MCGTLTAQTFKRGNLVVLQTTRACIFLWSVIIWRFAPKNFVRQQTNCISFIVLCGWIKCVLKLWKHPQRIKKNTQQKATRLRNLYCDQVNRCMMTFVWSACDQRARVWLLQAACTWKSSCVRWVPGCDTRNITYMRSYWFPARSLSLVAACVGLNYVRLSQLLSMRTYR